MNLTPPPPDLQGPRDSLDLAGLRQLRSQAANAPAGANPALRAAAKQFEALFLQQMMRSMREAVVRDEEQGSQAQDTFEGMFDREVTHRMADRGSLGLADMLERQVAGRTPPPEPGTAPPATGLPLQRPAMSRPLPAATAPLPAALALPMREALPLNGRDGRSIRDERLPRPALPLTLPQQSPTTDPRLDPRHE